MLEVDWLDRFYGQSRCCRVSLAWARASATLLGRNGMGKPPRCDRSWAWCAARWQRSSSKGRPLHAALVPPARRAGLAGRAAGLPNLTVPRTGGTGQALGASQPGR